MQLMSQFVEFVGAVVCVCQWFWVYVVVVRAVDVVCVRQWFWVCYVAVRAVVVVALFVRTVMALI